MASPDAMAWCDEHAIDWVAVQRDQTGVRPPPSFPAPLPVFALREVVRRSRLDELKALMGKVEFDVDPTTLRKKARRRG